MRFITYYCGFFNTFILNEKTRSKRRKGGDKGRDGFMCDDLTKERITELLNECETIDLPNTTLTVKSVNKTKKGGK